MSAWAYRCHSPDEREADWFVSQLEVERLSPYIRIVRVKVGADWKCALLDRTQTVIVENQLLRDVIASDEADCPQCAEMLSREEAAPVADATESISTAEAGGPDNSPAPEASSPRQNREHGATVQAAAISLQGHHFVVVVVPTTLVVSPGEADMAIDDLQLYFDSGPVVLMAQKEDGSPSYYGNSQLVDMLADIPIDKMPWKEYPVG
jgi:hypothetical protein